MASSVSATAGKPSGKSLGMGLAVSMGMGAAPPLPAAAKGGVGGGSGDGGGGGAGSAHQPPHDPHLLFDVAGVVAVTAALLVYGVLQERIMTVGFGGGGADAGSETTELFEFSIVLVLCNRLCTAILAFVYIAATEPNIRRAAPMQAYAYVSFTNVVATTCQYEALKYVSFAVQTLAKSAKAMPVMMWGTLFSGRRYPVSSYVHAGVVTLGCTVFLLAGDVSSRVIGGRDMQPVHYFMGAGLMAAYLAVDGLTSTWQDHLFRTYNMGICDQVLFTTVFSTALSFTAAVASGQLVGSVVFLMRYPEAMWWILALSMASAVVQLVISFTIKRFGAVVFATIMTTRQFFSVLLSCFYFATPLAPWQWVGAGIVFGALYYKVLYRGGPSKKPKELAAVDGDAHDADAGGETAMPSSKLHNPQASGSAGQILIARH